MGALGALLVLAALLGAACAGRPAAPSDATAARAPLPLQASYSAPVMSQSPLAIAQEGERRLGHHWRAVRRLQRDRKSVV